MRRWPARSTQAAITRLEVGRGRPERLGQEKIEGIRASLHSPDGEIRSTRQTVSARASTAVGHHVVQTQNDAVLALGVHPHIGYLFH